MTYAKRIRLDAAMFCMYTVQHDGSNYDDGRVELLGVCKWVVRLVVGSWWMSTGNRLIYVEMVESMCRERKIVMPTGARSGV